MAKSSDLGRNDIRYTTTSYLGMPSVLASLSDGEGGFLSCGDSVLGYDVSTINFSETNFRYLRETRIRSEIILVKKVRIRVIFLSNMQMFPNRRKYKGQRHWQLANLEIEEMDDSKKSYSTQKEQQREEFMKDLEEDPEMRSQIDLYKGAF